jgi:hypothetical protein
VSRVRPGDLPTERDTDKTRTYVQVIAVEAVVIVALWLFGRMFS